MSNPLAVITCGPASERLDGVRRITNFSTGALGAAMAETLAGAGWRVWCLRGEASTSPAPCGVEVRSWRSNADLENLLRDLPEEPAVVLHAAALADFGVASVAQGGRVLEALPEKLDSRGGELVVTLRPVEKLIGKLRGMFGGARLVGWKYEADLDAGHVGAVSRARRQIAEARLDACVLNGPVLGEVLEWHRPGGKALEFPGRGKFLACLPELLKFSDG